MIDMSNIGRDFMPRQRPEGGFAPQGGQQPFTPPVVPQAPPDQSQMPPPGMGTQWGSGMGSNQVDPGFAMQPPESRFPGQTGGSAADRMAGGQVGFSQQPFGTPPPGVSRIPGSENFDPRNPQTLGPESLPGWGGGQVGTGQQPFAPVSGAPQMPPGLPPPPPGEGGYRAIRPGEDPMAYQQEMAAGGTFIGQPPGQTPPAPITPSGPGTFTQAPGMLQPGTGSLQPFTPGEQPGQIPGAGAPEAGAFPYPEQWGQAGDIYGQLAGGMPGMPDPQAMWGGYQQQAGDLSRELAEQAGMGVGSRYGSALQRNIADVGMRAGERFGGEMERMRMGDVAGQRQAMLGAAGGLSGLGGAQAMLPGQLAGQAMGLGGQYQGMQQQEYDRQMQEFMRTQPEYSPYLPYMQQGAQVPYGPQTYQPGFGSNMMDIGGMMGMYNMMGG